METKIALKLKEDAEKLLTFNSNEKRKGYSLTKSPKPSFETKLMLLNQDGE